MVPRLALARRLYPDAHIWHAEALRELGELLERRGQDGLRMIAESAAMYARLDSPFEAETRGSWAEALARRGDIAAAQATLEPVAQVCGANPDDDATTCLGLRLSRTRVWLAADDPAAALAEAGALMQSVTRQLSEDSPHRAAALEARGRARAGLGETEAARADFASGRDLYARLYGPAHPLTVALERRIESLDSEAGSPR